MPIQQQNRFSEGLGNLCSLKVKCALVAPNRILLPNTFNCLSVTALVEPEIALKLIFFFLNISIFVKSAYKLSPFCG